MRTTHVCVFCPFYNVIIFPFFFFLYKYTHPTFSCDFLWSLAVILLLYTTGKRHYLTLFPRHSLQYVQRRFSRRLEILVLYFDIFTLFTYALPVCLACPVVSSLPMTCILHSLGVSFCPIFLRVPLRCPAPLMHKCPLRLAHHRISFLFSFSYLSSPTGCVRRAPRPPSPGRP